jgi:hypothetical protein
VGHAAVKMAQLEFVKTGEALYTKEGDGTIQKWYVWAKTYNTLQFAVAVTKNAGFSAFKRYYSISDIGYKIFRTRKEAKNADS